MIFDKLLGQSKCELCGGEKSNLSMIQFDSHNVCKDCMNQINLSTDALKNMTFADLKALRYNSWDLIHLQINDIVIKNPDISLKAGEVCLFAAKGNIGKEKTKTVGYKTNGVHASVRIAKGISMRASDINLKAKKETFTETVPCRFYVTTDRYIGMAPKWSFSVNLSNVLKVELNYDTITIYAGSKMHTVNLSHADIMRLKNVVNIYNRALDEEIDITRILTTESYQYKTNTDSQKREHISIEDIIDRINKLEHDITSSDNVLRVDRAKKALKLMLSRLDNFTDEELKKYNFNEKTIKNLEALCNITQEALSIEVEAETDFSDNTTRHIERKPDISDTQPKELNGWEARLLEKERELVEKERELLKKEAEIIAKQQRSNELEMKSEKHPDYNHLLNENEVKTCVNTYSIKDYQTTSYNTTEMTIEEYLRLDKNEILETAREILRLEAPIQTDLLIKKIATKYGVNNKKEGLSYTDAVIKKLDFKKTRQQGTSFCWTPDQNPDTYSIIRVSAERDALYICSQELKNAICYALHEKGALEKEQLIKETSRVFGYKRCGQKIETAILSGIRYAKSKKYIDLIDGKYVLTTEQK